MTVFWNAIGKYSASLNHIIHNLSDISFHVPLKKNSINKNTSVMKKLIISQYNNTFPDNYGLIAVYVWRHKTHARKLYKMYIL